MAFVCKDPAILLSKVYNISINDKTRNPQLTEEIMGQHLEKAENEDEDKIDGAKFIDTGSSSFFVGVEDSSCWPGV
eukprot:CAMPEP_0195246348 /NCGR_PEP_ID=MMETSP0706-20130129/348_1 /TAXON_ID=33640 /ORGANISM="Asterionellopsis glacialis, Strain CCMP134" /LENGTH=75 /DNA_ID=CAMNT_0040297705 /DNA_START=373 /DNA_END=600 /DNA_ORIENTATION=+